MKISRVSFTNYKHFEDQEIVLKDGINAIIGENNSGKTSILHAIAAVFNLNTGLNIEEDFPSKLKTGSFTTRIELDVEFNEQEWMNLVELRTLDIPFNQKIEGEKWKEIISFLVENQISLTLRMEIQVVPNSRNQRRWGQMQKNELQLYKCLPKLYEKVPDLDKSKVMNNFDRIFFNAYINNPQNIPFKPYLIFPYLGEFNRNEKYFGYYDLQQKIRQNTQNIPIRAQLYHLKREDPTAFSQFQERMKMIFKSIDKVNVILDDYSGNFVLTLDEYKRDITTYGGGTQTFAKIFSLINYKDETIILLDEPDAHLHASLSKNFYDYLSELSKNKQIIFTTHLPNLIDEIPYNSIISAKIVNNTAVVKWIERKQELFDLLEKMGLKPTNYQLQLIEEAEKIILVEGPTDIKFLKRFIEKLNEVEDIDLDTSKIQFLPIKKLNAAHLNKIMDGLISLFRNKNFVYIRDRDEDSEEEIKRITNFSQFHVYIWQKRQIESYLLDKDAISSLIASQKSNSANQITNLVKKIEEIINDEIKSQYGRRLYDYVESSLRENRDKPEKEISINQNEEIDEQAKIMKQALFQRGIITDFQHIELSILKEIIKEYNLKWKEHAIDMIDAKKLIKRIRREMNSNFQEIDIINYMSEVPSEIKYVLMDIIFSD